MCKYVLVHVNVCTWMCKRMYMFAEITKDGESNKWFIVAEWP